jgi:hypothetical protein
MREEKTTLEEVVKSRDDLIMDSTALGRTMMMRMMMTEEMPLHPILLLRHHPLDLHHLLPHLRRLSKRKPLWRWCDRTTSGRGSLTRINLSNSQRSENTMNTHKYNTIY